MPIRPLFLTILAALSSADAAVLWTTTFSGANDTTRTLTNTTGGGDFTDTLTGTYSNLTFSDTSFTGSDFKNVAGGTYFSPNTNVDNPAPPATQNGGSWQTEFRYTGGTQTISLESVVFDIAWTNATASFQAGDSTIRDITLTGEYSIDGGGTWLALAAAQTFNLTVNPGTAAQQQQDRTFTLTSAATINHATQDLWIRVKAENSGNSAGAYVNIHDISFNGSVIPEPTVALLGSLGLLSLLRRRR